MREAPDFEYCVHCGTPYRIQDLREVAPVRYVCTWHYRHGMR